MNLLAKKCAVGPSDGRFASYLVQNILWCWERITLALYWCWIVQVILANYLGSHMVLTHFKCYWSQTNIINYKTFCFGVNWYLDIKSIDLSISLKLVGCLILCFFIFSNFLKGALGVSLDRSLIFDELERLMSNLEFMVSSHLFEVLTLSVYDAVHHHCHSPF